MCWQDCQFRRYGEPQLWPNCGGIKVISRYFVRGLFLGRGKGKARTSRANTYGAGGSDLGCVHMQV